MRKKRSFFSCYERSEGKKNLLFSFLEKNFLCYERKKRNKTCYWKKASRSFCYFVFSSKKRFFLCYLNKTTEVFVIFFFQQKKCFFLCYWNKQADVQSFHQNSCRKKTVIFVCPESRSRKQKQSSKSCYFCFQHNSCWKKTVIFVCPEKRNCYEVMKQRKTCYFAVSENQKLVIFCFFREPKTCYFVIDFMPQKVGCAFWTPSKRLRSISIWSLEQTR